MKHSVVIGSRGSKLALIQSESVASKIKELNPDLEVSIRRIITKGDRNHRTQFDRFTSVGVFVKELEEALIDGSADLAVHSLKDMPTQIPEGLCLAAVTERLDPRDVLVSGFGGLAELAPGSKIGSGSLRRAIQLTSYRPDLKVVNIRGNVDTRIAKVLAGEFDGVILAAAALLRLGWEDKITEYLPLEYFLPPVGQGALGIEIRSGDEEMSKIVASINHLPTWQSVAAERAFLSALGGGCRAPIAALGSVAGSTLRLEGMVADPDSKKQLRAVREGRTSSPEEVGTRLAEELLKKGAAKFVSGAKPG